MTIKSKKRHLTNDEVNLCEETFATETREYLNYWENRYLYNVEDQYRKNKMLSDAQLAKIKEFKERADKRKEEE